jgi:O-methyltransferase involved in polyketide biosynthesis
MPGVVDTYVEVDSQPIIELREEWLPGTGAVRIVGDGMRVGEWISSVAASRPESVAVVLEGVLAYQERGKVAGFFRDLADALPGAYVLFDSVSLLSVWAANRPAALASGRPRYVWSCWGTSRLIRHPRRWQIVREQGFMDQPRHHSGRFDGLDRAVYRLPVLRRSYRLTLARLPLPGPTWPD